MKRYRHPPSKWDYESPLDYEEAWERFHASLEHERELAQEREDEAVERGGRDDD